MNTLPCFFVTDLHGSQAQYETLFNLIEQERPKAVFIGGDLLPGLLQSMSDSSIQDDFIKDYLIPKFEQLQYRLGKAYPAVFVILGNDDAKTEEPAMYSGEKRGVWQYVHNKKVQFEQFDIYGYSYIPPSPILLKDWEKYDVSRYVDPGCVSPEEGYRSIPVEPQIIRYSTIKKDLADLTNNADMTNTVMLFHSPPYKCALDRAALDNKYIEHVPLDVHVGSIAIKEFIETAQPFLTLHGHIHESYRLTGKWRELFGKTEAFSAAHDGEELALIRFDLHNLADTTRVHI